MDSFLQTFHEAPTLLKSVAVYSTQELVSNLQNPPRLLLFPSYCHHCSRSCRCDQNLLQKMVTADRGGTQPSSAVRQQQVLSLPL